MNQTFSQDIDISAGYRHTNDIFKHTADIIVSFFFPIFHHAVAIAIF